MAVFWISAPLFGLITAVLFGTAELGLLAGLLNILNYAVCRRLTNHKPVRILSYRRWVMAVSLFSILIFVLVETVLSLSSDPAKGQIFENRDCLRNFVGSGVDDDSAEGEAIHFKCTEVNGTDVVHRTGNYSAQTGEVVCNQIAYSYNIGERVPYRESMGRPVRRCTDGLCAAVLWEDASDTSDDSLPYKGTLYLSQMTPRTFPKSKLELMPTQVSEVNLSDQLGPLSKRAASMYAIPVNEEGELRRRVLLGSENTTCPFVEEQVDTTEVTTWALVISATIWALSVVLFFGTLLLRKGTFFDMGNPLHWAKTARHDSARSHGTLPTLRLGEGGKDLIWITEFSPDEKELRSGGSCSSGM